MSCLTLSISSIECTQEWEAEKEKNGIDAEQICIPRRREGHLKSETSSVHFYQGLQLAVLPDFSISFGYGSQNGH